MAIPDISVIVPVYNVEQYLRECIDSILAQTYANFELLLVDDGSTDSSGSICDYYARLDSRVHVIHKSNGGVSSARNLALDYSSGEWICYVDGDDWVVHDYLEKLYKKAINDVCDIVFCDFYFSNRGNIRLYKTYSWDKQSIDGLGQYIATVWTTVWGSIHKKSLYIDNNFKSPIGTSYSEDFYLMVRLCYKAVRIAKIDEPLYYYRQQVNSIMHNLNSQTEADEIWVYSDVIQYFKSERIYDVLKKPMAWRMLKASQELALDPKRYMEFMTINRDNSQFILSNPFIRGKKLKIIMWLFAHKMGILGRLIIKGRKLVGRY